MRGEAGGRRRLAASSAKELDLLGEGDGKAGKSGGFLGRER